ncbi:Ca-activated chloride channel family protein [Sulfitobacter marinus]|uniref:Ca-activated chloride channel family protein n=1 Tax=Sulfitobacter marinus TaxID=394264 RepID=A0A1I6SW23_9RHOB|nr:tetratricopeptide repeat protein [Sulfitobacter marinus]SFS81073.1 Ca-activated chloride channel family protein [Sulfitobacter marinus]
MRALAIISALALALGLITGGTAPFGRVFLAMGLPSVAAPLFYDPTWHGVALFRAGDFDAAADRFAQAGAFYNLGNAEAHAGNYAAALEAFDMAHARGHPDAQANFDVVAAFYAGLGIDPEALALFETRKDGAEADSFVARGNARAAGTGSDVTNNNTMLGLAQLDSRGRQGVRRIFDDKFMLADTRWLAQLADVPGDYLAARILQEHKRRRKLGLSPPKAEDPR